MSERASVDMPQCRMTYVIDNSFQYAQLDNL